jgi:hypothetical protein
MYGTQIHMQKHCSFSIVLHFLWWEKEENKPVMPCYHENLSTLKSHISSKVRSRSSNNGPDVGIRMTKLSIIWDITQSDTSQY